MLDKLLTEEGRRRAAWILRNAGFEVDIEPEPPILEGNELSEYELSLFDEVEMLLYADEYERAYEVAMVAVRDLIRKGRFRSALYVCQMVGDEVVRREILKRGVLFYESRGDFKNAMEFAWALGDVERAKIYKKLYELSKIREPSE